MFQDGISGWLCEEMSGEGLSLDQMDVSGGLQSHIIDDGLTLSILSFYIGSIFQATLLSTLLLGRARLLQWQPCFTKGQLPL